MAFRASPLTAAASRRCLSPSCRSFRSTLRSATSPSRKTTAPSSPSIGAGAAIQTETPLLRRARDQLHAYFDGELTSFDLPLAPAGTPYRQRVWQALCAIPYGATRSYLDIAHAAGGSPRSVGQANGNNPIPIVIPCHRVVATTHLGGYSGGDGLATKRWLLALEAHAQPLLQPIPSAAA